MSKAEVYKSVRFCEKCGRDVKVVMRPQTVRMMICGQMENLVFDAAFCPDCDSVLCERGFDEVFMDLAMKRKAEIEAERAKSAKNNEM